MRKIICRRCGAEIDASLGECPVCGAVYYIIPDEPDEGPASVAEPSGRSGDEHVWTVDEILSETPEHYGDAVPQRPAQNTQRPAQNTQRPVQNTQRPAQNTQRPVQNTQRPVQNPQRPAQNTQRPAQNPRRPVQNPQRPVQNTRRPAQEQPPQRHHAPIDSDSAYYQDERRGLDNRRKGFIVGAVALLAILTVVLCIMSGAFDFGKNDEVQYMPDLVGLTEDSAKTILDSYDLKLDVTVVYEKSTEPEGTVIRQSVKEGKKLSKKDNIVLTVSEGGASDAPEETDEPAAKVQVPDLSNRTYDEARDLVTGLGLTITKTEGVYSDTVEEGRVVTQSPEKGVELSKGGMVVVTLSTGPAPTPTPKGHTISVTAGKGGAVSPKGQVSVTDGESMTFTITPDEGYEIREVKVDGTSVGAVESYTFTNVTGDHTIYAVFQVKTEPTPTPTPAETPTPEQPTEPPATDAPAAPTEPVTAP